MPVPHTRETTGAVDAPPHDDATTHPFRNALDTVLDGLMRRYKARVPDVQAVQEAMVAEGLIDRAGQAQNDHIAFRTMGVEHLGIGSFEKIWLAYGYDTIPDFNRFLEARGFELNDAGGKVETSADGLLRQSSTVAEMIEATFAGGDTTRISGSYVEFAERLPLPEYEHLPKSELTRDMRREGFEAGNADKIFESTYSDQTVKRRRT
jgi:hypothetical protein